MYGHEYRRGGFRFGCVPLVLVGLFVLLLFSGGFHRVGFFVWPLFIGIPFFFAGVIVTLIATQWWKHGGSHRYGEYFGDFFRGEKSKRGASDSDSDTFYA